MSSQEARALAKAQAEDIERLFQATATRGDRFADTVAKTVGSWKFIGWQSSMLALWILWNSLSATARFHFDQPPFIALNLLLSFQAAYTAPFIMMSQNRSGTKDRAYAESDFETNVSAATEIEEMHDHLDALVETVHLRTVTVQHLETLLERVARLEEQNTRLLAEMAYLRSNSERQT
ncbi:MAG TPA: DUF1003 domain-containing protein [Symbiobacteriaceae bacterium]